MTESISLLADDRHANEFIADDWETTELPVPVTDQATGGDRGREELISRGSPHFLPANPTASLSSDAQNRRSRLNPMHWSRRVFEGLGALWDCSGFGA